MGRQYSPKTFLRQAPNLLLKQYFRQKSIRLNLDWDTLDENDAEQLFAALARLPLEDYQTVESNFSMVNEQACEAGTLSVLEWARQRGKNWAGKFEAMQNVLERSFWTFLNDPEAFRAASNLCEIARLDYWRRRFVGEQLIPKDGVSGIKKFEAGLSKFYFEQGRGRLCHVDRYPRQNPQRYCYVGYPPRRLARGMIFVYRPEDGILELHARGNRRQEDILAGIFCKTILGLDGLPQDANKGNYNLSVFKDGNFRFRTEPGDGIQAVDIRQLCLDLNGNDGGQLTFSVKTSQMGSSAMDLLNRALNKNNVLLEDAKISKVRLRFAFAPEGNVRAKTLIFEIGWPDYCTLKDDRYGQIARKYLKVWRIANA